MSQQDHWQKVYSEKETNAVSWFQEKSELSLKLIEQANLSKDAHLIDVGGGASRLVDDLLTQGFEHIQVLDLSAKALEKSQQRLTENNIQGRDKVIWQAADICQTEFQSNSIDLWHDRAVFHFLTEDAQQQHYTKQAEQAIKSNGFLLIATFAEDGPDKCSGLAIKKYSKEQLVAKFADKFELISSKKEQHKTPFKSEQSFVYCLFKRK